ncbi:MAG: hydrolase 2, exosortase A system-associated [Methylovulum sp.]|nr:hydrolase 2, exosortase A system-associated [Methylovulum sp.]
MKSGSYLSIQLEPFFIQGEKGRLFCLFSPPKDKQSEVLLFLPSFAEELNRCRVMVAMQARIFAEKGVGCLLLDYYGTGDSEGDFSETHWKQWLQDAETSYAWLKQQGYEKIGLWGVRLGGLLAVELAGARPDRFSRLLLWQPVLDGKAFFTQFLRIRLAMLMDRGEPKETTQQMRDQLQQGQSLEIAGYEITSQLACGIDSKNLLNFKQISTSLPIDWFESVMNEQAGPSLASQKVIAQWQQQGILITPHTFLGPTFWQLYERQLTPDLLDKTIALFN